MNKNDERYINFPPEVVYRTDWHVHDYIVRKGVDNPDKREIIGIGKCGYMLSNQNALIDLVPFGEEGLWEKVIIEPIFFEDMSKEYARIHKDKFEAGDTIFDVENKKPWYYIFGVNKNGYKVGSWEKDKDFEYIPFGDEDKWVVRVSNIRYCSVCPECDFRDLYMDWNDMAMPIFADFYCKKLGKEVHERVRCCSTGTCGMEYGDKVSKANLYGEKLGKAPEDCPLGRYLYET